MGSLRILCGAHDVEPYIDIVRQASDANRSALGFLPATVFGDYARREKLLIAIRPQDGAFCGYLLFDRKFPRATVLQMYCEPAFRRCGVAASLIRELKQSLTSDGFLSIKARVAEDLIESNSFWERQSFYVKERKLGGVSTGRTILVRVHELDTPQLFARSGLTVSGSDSLGLISMAGGAPPMYLIDLNVVFDVVRQRSLHESAVSLLRASHIGECRLAISDEMAEELRRARPHANDDPMMSLIEALPKVRLPRGQNSENVEAQLARVVFPEKVYPSGLTHNDLSDVRHIATAVLTGLSGFITRDGRLLRASAQIQSGFGVQVVAPTDFAASEWAEGGSEFEVGSGARVDALPLSEGSYEDVRDLLLRSGVSAANVVGAWLPGDVRDGSSSSLVVRNDGQVTGYITWSRLKPGANVIQIRAAVDESHLHAVYVSQMLLTSALDSFAKGGLARLMLDTPSRQVSLREAGHRVGFRAIELPGMMAKLAVGCIVTGNTWAIFRDQLLSVGIELPHSPPAWKGHTQLIEIRCPDGDKRFVRLDALETLLSPVLLCLDGRPAVIVPVRPKFSASLLGHSRQLSLAPKLQAEQFHERMYLSDPRTLTKYMPGEIVLFYESGSTGERAIVAAARIISCYLIERDEMKENSLAKSVLTDESLSDIGKSKDKAAFVFDNIIPFPYAVNLSVLRELGYSETKLITANRVSAGQLAAILRKGCVNE